MTTLDLQDIQGFIARGYGKLSSASYLLLKMEDPIQAKKWLQGILPQITSGKTSPDKYSLHIAFTTEGLRKMGLKEEELSTFSREFVEGMADKNRSQFLGDVETSAPENWKWGRADDPVDILLLLFAKDEDILKHEYEALRKDWTGVRLMERLDTYAFDSPLEHFGFADGISQPFIEGLSQKGPPENTLATGEIILGYKNEYGKMTNSPRVNSHRDPMKILEKGEVDPETADLGKNGTYLVFRDLKQNVKAFWNFVNEMSKKVYGSSDPDKRFCVAAKMVGRWPSGAPITLCPDKDDINQSTANSFFYRDIDAEGKCCPMGAHIRRANPRDGLEGSKEESIQVSNRHRILRRGRPYGAPISRTLDIDEILQVENETEKEDCGLHFICLNTDLARQFEFIQHSWIVNPKFAGQYSDSDPIMGKHDGNDGTFTIQSEPVRIRLTGIERFVDVRGGAYFFLPGLRALKFLTHL